MLSGDENGDFGPNDGFKDGGPFLTHSGLFCSSTTPSKKKTSLMPVLVKAFTQHASLLIYSFHWPPHTQSSQEYQERRQAMPSTTSVGPRDRNENVTKEKPLTEQYNVMLKYKNMMMYTRSRAQWISQLFDNRACTSKCIMGILVEFGSLKYVTPLLTNH